MAVESPPLPALPHVRAPEAVRISDPGLAHVVRQSVRGAARRLQSPRCQLLLQEFADQDGRALEQVMNERGFAPETYLEHLLFYDGAAREPCLRDDVFALTATPGSRVVQVCGRRFEAVARRHPRLAEASVIHEMLHSLGLGENPPDPRAITERVLDLC